MCSKTAWPLRRHEWERGSETSWWSAETEGEVEPPPTISTSMGWMPTWTKLTREITSCGGNAWTTWQTPGWAPGNSNPPILWLFTSVHFRNLVPFFNFAVKIVFTDSILWYTFNSTLNPARPRIIIIFNNRWHLTKIWYFMKLLKWS